MALFTFNAKTGKFKYDLKDARSGTPAENREARRYNKALEHAVKQAQSAFGTKGQYMQFKRKILNRGSTFVSEELANELLADFDKFYKKQIIQKPFSNDLVPDPKVGKFDSEYYLNRYPDLRTKWQQEEAKGNLDFTYFYGDINNWAGGHYLNHGVKEGRYANFISDPANAGTKTDEFEQFNPADQTITNADIQAIRDRELDITMPRASTLEERLRNDPRIKKLAKDARKGNNTAYTTAAKELGADLNTFAGFLQVFSQIDDSETQQIKQELIDEEIIDPGEAYITTAEDALNTALGQQGLEKTEQFGLLTESVLKDAIRKLDKAKEQEQMNQIFGMGQLNQVMDLGSNIADELMADIGGGSLPGGYADELQGQIDSMLGLGNNTIVNWQKWFDDTITEKYAKGYEDVFENLETEKRILESSEPSTTDYEVFVDANEKIKNKYIKKHGGKSPLDDDYLSRAEFGKRFYREAVKNGTIEDYNTKSLSKKDYFDAEEGVFSTEFLRDVGFQTTDDLVDYLEETPEGRNVLYSLTDEAFIKKADYPGELTKVNVADRIDDIDQDILDADSSGNYDYILTKYDPDGEAIQLTIESQFMRDFINDYLRPRFDTSKSMDEFIDYLNVEDNYQNPWQTQSTYNALQDLAKQKTDTFLEQIKAGTTDGWDADYYMNPFKDRDKDGPQDESRYEQKLKLQRKTFNDDIEAALQGDERWLNKMYEYGIGFERTAEGSEDYNKGRLYRLTGGKEGLKQFAKMHYKLVGQVGKDIDGNDIMLNGRPAIFSPFDNMIDADRIQRYVTYEMMPVLLEEVDDVGQIFGPFISSEEFAEDVLEDYGLSEDGEFGSVLKELGLDENTDLQEVKDTLIEAIQGGNAAAIRESLKVIQQKGETPTQEELGASYIEREIDDIVLGDENDGLYQVFKQAGFKGNEKEFYEEFFPGQDKDEVKAEFGDISAVSAISNIDMSSPSAAIADIEGALDFGDSSSGFGSSKIKTKKSKSGTDFLDEFTSGFAGFGDFGGMMGF